MTDNQPGYISLSFGMAIVAFFVVLILYWLGFWLFVPAIIFAVMAWGCFSIAKKGEEAKMKEFDWVPFATGSVVSVCAAIYFGMGGQFEEIPVTKLPSTVATLPSSNKNPVASATAPKKTITTNIDDILDTYEANQIGGLKKFGGATLKITGEVVRVREAMGVGIIVLASPDSGRELELGFSDAATNMLAPLLPGDNIEATCPSIVEAMSVIVVGGCSNVTVR